MQQVFPFFLTPSHHYQSIASLGLSESKVNFPPPVFGTLLGVILLVVFAFVSTSLFLLVCGMGLAKETGDGGAGDGSGLCETPRLQGRGRGLQRISSDILIPQRKLSTLMRSVGKVNKIIHYCLVND